MLIQSYLQITISADEDISTFLTEVSEVDDLVVRSRERRDGVDTPGSRGIAGAIGSHELETFVVHLIEGEVIESLNLIVFSLAETVWLGGSHDGSLIAAPGGFVTDGMNSSEVLLPASSDEAHVSNIHAGTGVDVVRFPRSRTVGAESLPGVGEGPVHVDSIHGTDISVSEIGNDLGEIVSVHLVLGTLDSQFPIIGK